MSPKAEIFSSLARSPVMTGSLAGGSAVLVLAQTMFGVSTFVCGRWNTEASSSIFNINPSSVNKRLRYALIDSLSNEEFVTVNPFKFVLLNCLKVPTIACIRRRAFDWLSPKYASLIFI